MTAFPTANSSLWLAEFIPCHALAGAKGRSPHASGENNSNPSQADAAAEGKLRQEQCSTVRVSCWPRQRPPSLHASSTSSTCNASSTSSASSTSCAVAGSMTRGALKLDVRSPCSPCTCVRGGEAFPGAIQGLGTLSPVLKAPFCSAKVERAKGLAWARKWLISL